MQKKEVDYRVKEIYPQFIGHSKQLLLIAFFIRAAVSLKKLMTGGIMTEIVNSRAVKKVNCRGGGR